MKEDNFFWEYKYEPGRTLIKSKTNNEKIKPLVSIITSYYNGNQFFNQTINCVLNQTFQSWEWIIVDDGSNNEEAIKYLNRVEKIDSRIKIYHKKNEGLALGRDYAIKYSTTKYILPLDSDDLIEPTYIETLYWALETNPKASWAFTYSVGFGRYMYLWDKSFDSEEMKKNNTITATALIRKDKLLEVGGYGKAKRYVNEDWHLWLRMLSNNQFPVQVGYYGFWYRRREESLLADINNKDKKEYELKMKELKIEADKIIEKIDAIKYPKEECELKLDKYNIQMPKIEILNRKTESELYILPYLGTDKKMYKNIKKQSKKKNVYIITLQNSKYSQYYYRQKYEEFSIIYDLTTFIESKYWISFIQYLLDTRNIKNIYISNTIYKEELKRNFNMIDIQNCRISKILYFFGILKYKFSKLLIVRGLKKICTILIERKG